MATLRMSQTLTKVRYTVYRNRKDVVVSTTRW
jgi:hypothetical protein